jgi:hypothetical protein
LTRANRPQNCLRTAARPAIAAGLAKGRFSLTLYWFLKDHYASGPESAKALASYLESVDSGPGGASRAGTKSSRLAAGSSRSSLRPPMPVPGR